MIKNDSDYKRNANIDILNQYPHFKHLTKIYISPNSYAIKQIEFNENMFKESATLELNADALKILQNFNGRLTLKEIIFNNSASPIKANESIGSVLDFIEKLRKEINISFSAKHTHSLLKIYGSTDFIIPRHVSLELTEKCNLKCIYCYREPSFNNKKNGHMDNAFNNIKELINTGISTFEITGGEPLLHPDIKNILEYLGSHCPLTALLTNGTLFNDEIIAILKKFNKNYVVQISMDSVNEDDFNRIVGVKGYYNKVIENIYKLSSHGIFVRVTSVLESIKDINIIYKIAEKVKELGAKSYSFTIPVSFGKAKNVDFSNISKDEYDLILKLNKDLEINYPDFVETPNTILSKYDKSEPNCGAGHRSITISPDNVIRICPMVNERIGLIGVKNNSSYMDIFKKSDMSDYQKLRSPKEKYCIDCKWMFYCHGCVGRALSKITDIGVENCKWINDDETAKFLLQKDFTKIPKNNIYCVKSHLD